MARNSVKAATQDFSKVVHADVPRSTFNRNSTLVTTLNAAHLVPVYVDEVLPGDTFKMTVQHVARLLTPFTPTMDNMDLEFFAFFVPNRIVWENWNALMGENNTSAWTPSSAPAGTPITNSSTISLSKKLGDYYGLPVGINPSQHNINVLPFRGYRKIWNDWFRNQNVQAPIIEYKTNTGDQSLPLTTYNMDLLKVNKPHDYFTSALPAPQKGESQLIPIELNEFIPVISSATEHTTLGMQPLRLRTGAGVQLTGPVIATSGAAGVQSGSGGGTSVFPSNLFAYNNPATPVTTSTINDLRTAFQIQKLYERDARGGTRYVEMLKAHFGVDAGDYRLQRPEYLGHAKTSMDIQQIAQTSSSSGSTTPLGHMAAYGHSQGSDYLFNKSFVEHGFIHIFAVARHKKTYQYGLDRFWSRRDRLDYYVPVLAHISEQPIYQKEIYALANNPTTVFGYQEAWSDYRYKPSRISGQMRSGVSGSFDIWHYADIYSSAPTLSDSWMLDNSNTNLARTLAVTGADQILLNIRFELEATRPMPTHSIPGMIDHF
jgi:hypothetical protein